MLYFLKFVYSQIRPHNLMVIKKIATVQASRLWLGQ